MATCVVEQPSPKTSMKEYPRKLLRASTYDSLIPTLKCPKRLLNEHNEYQDLTTKFDNDDAHPNKKKKRDLFVGDVNDNNHHLSSFSSISPFENEIDCPVSTSHQGRQNFIYINDKSHIESSTVTQISKSTTATILTSKTMLACQQHATLENNNENDQVSQDISSNFITAAQLAAFMTSLVNTENDKLLIIDCGVPLRFNERRLKDSFLLNINDKLSRKRLLSRGLNNFLNQNQLNRLNQSEIIVLYSDSIYVSSSSCSNSMIQQDISPVTKCIMNEIKRYASDKIIYVLQSSFDEFYQHYPTYCYVSASNLNSNDNLLPSRTMDIESYIMSEVLPGLYLGNARDAQDTNLLNQNNIKSIVNISKSIPCYYENESLFDYFRIPCNDSCQEDILQYFEKSFDYIHEKLSSNQNILVHCQGGISRSPSFIIGYLMKYHSKTFDQAYTFVKEQRKIINPNLGFLHQLTRYEQMILSSMQ